MKVEIHYCHEWNYEPYAARLAEEVEKGLGAVVEIVPEYGGEGNLDVYADYELVFSSRKENRYPEDGELVKLLKK